MLLRPINISNHITMSQNHSKLDNLWNNFEDNNSPIHNEAICPLFYTEKKSENPQIVDPFGNYYELKNNSLLRNNTIVGSVTNQRFVKETLDYKGDLACISNGHVYTAERNNGVVTVKRDGILDHTVLIKGDVLTERLKDGYYFALTSERTTNNQWVLTFYGWAIYHQDITTTGSLNILGSPIITVYGDSACVAFDSGVSLRSLLTYCYYIRKDNPNHSLLLGTSTILNYENVQVPSYTTYNNYTYFPKIDRATSQVNGICEKRDGKYYDTTTGDELTFDTGYKPVFQEDNLYRYNIYTTTYTYRVETNETGQDRTISWKLNINSSNIPVETSVYNFTASNSQFYTISIVSNFGFQTSQDFMVPSEMIINYPDIGKTWNVPAAYINTNTPFIVTVAELHTTTNAPAVPPVGGSFVMLDDGKFYLVPLGQATVPSETRYCGYTFCYRPLGSTYLSLDNPSFAVAGTTYFWNSDGGFYSNYNSTVSYGYNYYRLSIECYSDDNHYSIGYDSLTNIGFYGCGFIRKDDKTMAPYGGKSDIKDGFTLLVNNDLLSGISYNGILVTPWNSVDSRAPVSISNNNTKEVLYRDSNTAEWIKIKVVEGYEMKLIENRFIVINTTSPLNCYDTVLGTMNRFADDFNARVWKGFSITYGNATYSIVSLTTGQARNISAIVTSGTDRSAVLSAVFPAVVVQCAASNGRWEPTTSDCDNVDLFYSPDNSGTPIYDRSIKNVFELSGFYNYSQFYKPRMKGTSYPLYSSASSIMKSPSIFAEFIMSGNNKDYIKDGSVSSELYYKSGATQPTLVTKTTGDIYNLDSVFVVQSIPFAVIDSKIYALNYINGAYQGRDCIIDVTGMRYIGSIPAIAFFYSPNNRAIYSFTGDADLAKLRDASAISEIYKTWYNPATQTIFFSTNDGLYMLNGENSYKQLFYDVKDVVFLKEGSTAIVDGDTLYVLYYEDAEGRKTNQVRLSTGLLGAGKNEIFTISKWHFKLFSDQRRNGRITVKSYRLLDNGKIDEWESYKDITTSDWDKTFNCTQVDFTPENNKGIGLGISVISDFAISDIITEVADVTEGSGKAPAKFRI